MSEFNYKKRWKDVAELYRQDMKTSYHINRLDMVGRLLNESDLSGIVLDYGCGDGVMSERVLSAGGRVLAIDLDPSMVESTKRRLRKLQHNNSNYDAMEGDTDALTNLAGSAYDTILAINVLAYMDDQDVHQFYIQSYRLLRPGGVLIVSHSNELFDLFTLNKYTVSFFKSHFSPFVERDEIASLLVYPNLPERRVYPTRANPLNYRFILESYGFNEVQQEFAIFHNVPPLLMKNFNPDDLQQRNCPDTTNWPASEKWKLMFMCSIFGSRAIRTVRSSARNTANNSIEEYAT